MNVKSARRFLLYCTIINYVLLLVWYLINRFTHAWIYHLTCDGMMINPDDFDRIMLNGMVDYKLVVIIFNLVPCIVLYMMGSKAAESCDAGNLN